MPQPFTPEKERDRVAAKLNSLGVSLGTTFSHPWFVGTISGTLAPSRYSFFDIGVDFGFVSGHANADYYSFYPFAHYAIFVPYKDAGGWYTGAGVGFMLATYQFHETNQFSEGEISENTFAFDLCTGVIIKNVFNISYTLRTDFKTVSNKIAVGFVRRF